MTLFYQYIGRISRHCKNRPFTGWIGQRHVTKSSGSCPSKLDGEIIPLFCRIQAKQLQIIIKISTCHNISRPFIIKSQILAKKLFHNVFSKNIKNSKSSENHLHTSQNLIKHAKEQYLFLSPQPALNSFWRYFCILVDGNVYLDECQTKNVLK